jgi:hypothetical protein
MKRMVKAHRGTGVHLQSIKSMTDYKRVASTYSNIRSYFY